ncbi:hypothetical protein K6U06_23760 [Acidiferrimicrobium sp. IK]|nr:hypothetical protein [Acidiferrimicrobium sp. IK]MCU4187395.1 hypothetical protein [Acidiferrimicrobium sp. IK]
MRRYQGGGSSLPVDLRRLSPVDAARLVEVALTLAASGVVVVARRGPFLVIHPRRRSPRALAVALRQAFADLGPTYVKLGQLIASSPGPFPEVLSDEFRGLLDQCPAEAPGRVRALVQRELGVPLDEVFKHFDEPRSLLPPSPRCTAPSSTAAGRSP